MLNIHKLISQIETMSDDNIKELDLRKRRLNTALEIFKKDYDLEVIINRIKNAKVSWLLGIPIEEPNKVYTLPEMSGKYIIISTDGSQIMPDHHEITLCYLINIGYVILSYGDNNKPVLDSTPVLFYKEEDIYEEVDGRKGTIRADAVSAKRTKMEAEKIIELINTLTDRTLPKVAFMDGTLIQWPLNPERSKIEKDTVENFLKMFEEARRLKVPVGGYISSSRANDVVNTLKVLMCRSVKGCQHCEYEEIGDVPPCQNIEGVNDSMLFNCILKPGERSIVFMSQSKVLDYYGEHRIGFFYINVGEEIARVEVPEWVIKDRNLLNLVHFVAYDQAKKGMGYPISLLEAHNQAVVTNKEKEIFYEYINKYFIKKGLKSSLSYKLLRKRSGVL